MASSDGQRFGVRESSLLATFYPRYFGYYERAVSVFLLPELAPLARLKDAVAVVIDVLRATTTIIHALAAGCVDIGAMGQEQVHGPGISGPGA